MKYFARWIGPWFLALLLGSALASAQSGIGLPGMTETPAAPAKPDEDFDAQRKEVAERVLVAQRTLEAIEPAAAKQDSKAQRAEHELELLKQLDSLYAQRQSADESRKELETTAAELDTELANLRRTGPAEQRPYSFLLLDSLRDKLATAQSRADAMKEAIDAASEELDSAKQTNDHRQAQRRQIKEAAEHGRDDEQAAQAAIELKMAELEADVAEQSLAVRRAELEHAKRAQQVHQVQLTLLKETAAAVEKDVVFSPVDLRSQLVDIDKQESDLKQEIQDAESTLRALDQQWTEARHELTAAAKAAPALVERERTAKLARDCQLKRIATGRKQFELIEPSRDAWRRRFALATHDFERPDPASWLRESTRSIEQVECERRLADLLIGQARKELASLEERRQSAEAEDGEATQWLDKQRDLFDQLIDAQGAHQVKLDGYDNLFHKLGDEIHAKLQTRSLWDRLAAGGEAASELWNKQLAIFDDHPVTVGKVVGGVGLVILGILLSRWFTATFARAVLTRLRIHGGAAVAFESLAFYILVLAWALVAFYRMHVPLTVFTFMGGAVAIGVGFGSQKILNNFISGVILLVEQPVRVGDLIEIGSLQGTVASIGTRSTRVRTGSNAEIIIPNSSFLESNVVNWTLGRSTIRCTVTVEAAHGSPAREVVRWLKRAADEHGLVLKKPEPAVSFVDIGTDSLRFQLSFSIDIRMLGDRGRIESDLRFMIDEHFRTAGLAFAAPRRDLHLGTATPLEVRVVPQPTSQDALTDVDRRAA